MADCRVIIAGRTIPNPVITASGTFGYGLEYTAFGDLSKLGAIVVKGLSLKPIPGNPPQRIVETRCGLLNAIGLANIGVDAFIDEMMPKLAKTRANVIVNIYGKTEEEYVEVAKKLDQQPGIFGLELNVSCPNVAAGGMAFGTDPQMVFSLTNSVRKATALPLIVKLTPNVTDPIQIAQAAENGGADAVSAINTLLGMAVDLENRRPVLGNITGGLSGPAIKPVALRIVYQVARAVKVPVIGIGGIMSGKDALEFLVAGASAIQVGTAIFADPQVPWKIVKEIEEYLDHHGISHIHEIIGTLRTD